MNLRSAIRPWDGCSSVVIRVARVPLSVRKYGRKSWSSARQSRNNETCSDSCRALLDGVVQNCVLPDDAVFAANGAKFHDEQQKVIPWRTEISLKKVLGDTNDLSEACWDYYLESSNLDIIPAVSEEDNETEDAPSSSSPVSEEQNDRENAPSSSSSFLPWASLTTAGAFSVTMLLF